MKFDPIDWNIYNRPPYFPQWLSRGETKKFVSYSDSQLVKIEEQINKLSKQYEIDEAKAAMLDRIGRILSEPREGNDDELYRLLIRLRTLLNTTNGTVNDIIKVVKFAYSSEEIRIIPNYPAAIIILRDGHLSPHVDFNRILAQVIGAGIGYETRELINVRDSIPITDFFYLRIFKEAESALVGPPIFYDGTFKHNGEIYYNSGGMEDYFEVKTQGAPIIDGMSVKESMEYRIKNSDGEYLDEDE